MSVIRNSIYYMRRYIIPGSLLKHVWRCGLGLAICAFALAAPAKVYAQSPQEGGSRDRGSGPGLQRGCGKELQWRDPGFPKSA